MELLTDHWWMPTQTRRDRSPLPIGSITRTRFDQDENGLSSMVSPAVVVNVLWMLDDFSANNGGTLLVPGSHLIGRQPD